MQKQNRNICDLTKIKPTLGRKFAHGLKPSMYIFKDPVFEEFFNRYLDHTQSLLNEYLKLEQFSVIKWKYGIPVFIIEIISEITGEPSLISNYFKSIKEPMDTLNCIQLDKQSPFEK